ncbi:flavin-containing monooxygenase [Nocardia sp. NPDC003482]
MNQGISTVDVVVVGAGLGGLGTAVALRRAGIGDFVVLEKADDVGGTWRENTYPGCACDVTSFMYSYSFAQRHDWTRMYPSQPEILDYIKRVTKEADIESHIRFRTEVVSCEFDEDADRWTVRTRTGETYRPRFVVLANGVLHRPYTPDYPGLDEFTGRHFHAARWDDSVDLTGKRVAVVGTGASAVQFVPIIAETADHLEVFQRSAHWVLAKPDRVLGPRERRLIEAVPALRTVYRDFAYWSHEIPVLGFKNPRLLKLLEFAARRALRKQVPDPELRAKLTPDYTIGCKRILLSSDYYPALLRDNVDLVTAGIERFTDKGIRTVDGREHEADVVIFATGFATDNRCANERIIGRAGLDIRDAWRDGMQAYLGMTVTGFPNLFLIMGPNSGGGSQSILFVIENQIRYIVKCLKAVRAQGMTRLEVRADRQRAFNDRLHRKLARTVWNAGGCDSWFLDHTGYNRQSWPGTGTSYWWATRAPDRTAFEWSRAAGE